MLTKESLTPLRQASLGKGAYEFVKDSLGFERLIHALDEDFAPFPPEELGLTKGEVKTLWVVGSLDAEEVRDRFGGRYESTPERGLDLDRWQGLLLVAIDMPESAKPTRTVLSSLLRKMNRKAEGLPVIGVFRTSDGQEMSIGAIERKEPKRLGHGDRLGKVSLLRGVCLTGSVHQGHLRILERMHLGTAQRSRMTSVGDLERHWRDVFSVQVLNKEFYGQLFDWYLWAKTQVQFPMPKDSGISDAENAERACIRLVTRLLFTWFLRARDLVPKELFDKEDLGTLLKGFNPEGHGGIYYNAILQNFFFACLNAPWRARSFLPEGAPSGYNNAYLDHTKLRGRELFRRPDEFLALLQNVPELNAALFECLDLRMRRGGENLPEERWDGFSAKPSKRALVPDCVLWGQEREALVAGKADGPVRVRVKGLIPILESFLFTVEENTPDEEDVALDPELLGRVFENLLAAVNPETSDAARKTTGSFYTPREVVHFMADQALRNHLARDLDSGRHEDLKTLFIGDNPFDEGTSRELVKALSRCRILDPACGSGAFPMGVLERMVALLRVLDPGNRFWKEEQLAMAHADLASARKFQDLSLREKAVEAAQRRIAGIEASFGKIAYEEDYTRKLYLIEHCIHGVDIQPTAVQITLLRFFLTLLIDQRVDHEAENRGLSLLPNLGTKFVAANSLISLEKQEANIPHQRVEEIKDELREVRRERFYAHGWDEKKRVNDREDELRTELLRLLKTDKMPEEGAQHLASWSPQDTQRPAGFFDPDIMFGLRERFDVVIGNPPYVRQERIQDLKPALKERYECFTGSADLFVYFYERAVKLLRPGGSLVFITSNKYYKARYGEKLRQFLTRELTLEHLIDFADAPVFEAIAYASILSGTRRRPPREHTLRYLKWLDTQAEEFVLLPAVVLSHAAPIAQSQLPADGWSLESGDSLALLKKIRAAGTPLGDFVKGRMYRGVLTGLNEAFVVDRNTRDGLIDEHPSSAEVLKPFLRGRDVKRWKVESKDLWLICIASSQNQKHPWTGLPEDRAEAAFKKVFPAIHRRFDGFRQSLIDRDDQGQYFWELRSCAYYHEFEEGKIVYPDMFQSRSFVWDDTGAFLVNTLYFIASPPLWLLGYLNSSLFEWFYRNISNQNRGGTMRAFSDKMKTVPIPSVPKAEGKRIEHLVSKAMDGDLEVEEEIDAEIFCLFSLSEAEIAIIRADLNGARSASDNSLADSSADAEDNGEAPPAPKKRGRPKKV